MFRTTMALDAFQEDMDLAVKNVASGRSYVANDSEFTGEILTCHLQIRDLPPLILTSLKSILSQIIPIIPQNR